MSRFKVAVVCLLACSVVLLATHRYEGARQCIGIATVTAPDGGTWMFRGFADGSIERLYVDRAMPHPDFPGWRPVAPADLAPPAEAPPRPVAPPAAQQPGDESVTVYATNTGTKYHAAGCGYLVKSSIKMTLKEARAKGLAPCSKCHPPG